MFKPGQFIFVKNPEKELGTPDTIPHWFARVLEVRAANPAHVYLRVFWLYRPEDLPGGRKPHHGQSELIVSNHMEIIEVQCVESMADVVYWQDDPDNAELPAEEQLFWRQSLDITKSPNTQLSVRFQSY